MGLVSDHFVDSIVDSQIRFDVFIVVIIKRPMLELFALSALLTSFENYVKQRVDRVSILGLLVLETDLHGDENDDDVASVKLAASKH